MSKRRSHPLEPILLRVPGGAQYHLDASRDDLADWRAPGRHAPPHSGPPLEVEVVRGGERYAIPVGPGELAHLLSRATLAADHAAGLPDQPPPVANPARGRGLRDPEAHRLGPNVDRAPDPGHKGVKRRRTP
jgi:hypothetical protein